MVFRDGRRYSGNRPCWSFQSAPPPAVRASATRQRAVRSARDRGGLGCGIDRVSKLQGADRLAPSLAFATYPLVGRLLSKIGRLVICASRWGAGPAKRRERVKGAGNLLGLALSPGPASRSTAHGPRLGGISCRLRGAGAGRKRSLTGLRRGSSDWGVVVEGTGRRGHSPPEVDRPGAVGEARSLAPCLAPLVELHARSRCLGPRVGGRDARWPRSISRRWP